MTGVNEPTQEASVEAMTGSFSPANLVSGFVDEVSTLLVDMADRARTVTRTFVGIGMLASAGVKTAVVDRIQSYHDSNRGNLR